MRKRKKRKKRKKKSLQRRLANVSHATKSAVVRSANIDLFSEQRGA